MLRRLRNWLLRKQGPALSATPVTQPSARKSWSLARHAATAGDRTVLVYDIQEWLAVHLGNSSPPYGYRHYRVTISLCRLEQEQRDLLWEEALPVYTSAQRVASLEQTERILMALPLADYPQASHVEVSIRNLSIDEYHAEERSAREGA